MVLSAITLCVGFVAGVITSLVFFRDDDDYELGMLRDQNAFLRFKVLELERYASPPEPPFPREEVNVENDINDADWWKKGKKPPWENG